MTTTPCDGITLLQIDETFLPTNSNAAIEAIPSYHTEQLKEGEGDVIWTIYLKTATRCVCATQSRSRASRS